MRWRFLSAILSTSTNFMNKLRFLYTISVKDKARTYLLFRLPGVHLAEAEIFYFFLTHQIVLHPALEIVDLELLATFGHQLVLVKTCVVADSVLLALVEVVQRERTLIRG